jgi:hypothetical protein
VIEHSEACLGSEGVHDVGKLTLGGLGNRDILNSAACHAHDMVMVSGEPLSQLEAADSIWSVVLLEDLGSLKECKGPIQR